MTEPPLPELHEGDLDRAGVETLFADLAACAEVQHVRTRGAPGSGDAEPSLDEARDRLLAGTVKAVQIVYRFEGEGWCDTLMATPGGVRVVRVRQPTV
jgi:hypothetical protein